MGKMGLLGDKVPLQLQRDSALAVTPENKFFLGSQATQLSLSGEF